MESAVREKLKNFVKNFVVIYENRLKNYMQRIDDNIEKPGTTANFLNSILGQGKKATGSIKNKNIKILTAVGCVSLVKLIHYFGVKYNREQVKKILYHLYLFIEEPETVRKVLVESAYRIFCSFEYQFVHVTADKTWQRAMTKLAEDAVDRIIRYYRANPDITFCVGTVVDGIILGESRKFNPINFSGRKIKNHSTNMNWNTTNLFSKVGLTDKTKYYCKENGSSDVATFGYRLLLPNDNLKLYQEEENPNGNHVYEYILNQDEDIEKQVQELLNYTNKQDPKLKELEKSIIAAIDKAKEKAIVEEEAIAEEQLQKLKMELEDNMDKFQEYLLKEIAILMKEEANGTIVNITDGFQQTNININNVNDMLRKEINPRIENISNILQEGVNQTLDNVSEIQQATNLKLENVSDILQQETNPKLDAVLGLMKTNQSDQISKTKKPFWFRIMKPLLLYIGRQDELRYIDTNLQEKTTVVISGLDGVGKSELVFQYIHKYVNRDCFVIHINASTAEAATKGFKVVYKKLGLKNEDEELSTELLVEEVYKHIGERGLFFFDNAENYASIEKFLPLTTNCQPLLLITSPNVSKKEWSSRRLKIETLQLDGFTDAEAKEFVKASLEINNVHDEDIEKLVKKLYNFPLALNQAVAYINGTNYDLMGFNVVKNLTEYLDNYDRDPKIFLNHEIDKKMNTTTTLKSTVDKVNSANDHGPKAISMLNIMSYLMPNAIPQNIFLNELAEGSIDGMSLLQKYAIIKTNCDMLDVHGLVQVVVRLELQEERNELEQLKKVFALLLNDRQYIEICSPHIKSAWKYSQNYSDRIENYIKNCEHGSLCVNLQLFR